MLRERGHEVDLAVLDRRAGGKRRFLELRRRVRDAPKPDVVWAHFLVPAGLFASTVDAPLVVTAHGRDVRNIGADPRRRTPDAAGRRARVDGDRRLGLPAPRARGASCPRRAARRRSSTRASTSSASRAVDAAAGSSSTPAFVHVGSLTERKNVVRLADAFARLGRGSLTFVGDGPLRPQLEGRERVRIIGRIPHDDVPALAERRRRRLRAGADRAVRPGAAGGHGVRAQRSSRPASAGRPSSCRPRQACSSTRWTRTSCCARSRRPPRFPSPNEAARAAAAAARRQAAGGAGGGDSPASRSRSASLISTSGRDRFLERRAPGRASSACS